MTNVKRFLAVILPCLLCLPGFAIGADQTKPNLVFIFADDLGYGDLGCYNKDSKIPTPNLDRLANEGVRFTDAHAPTSVCSPTRYAILTGRYSWRTRLQRGVLGPWDAPLIAAERFTVASLLNQHGYTTACIGKWHLGMNWPTKDGQPPSSRTDPMSNVDFTKPIADGPTMRGFDHQYGHYFGAIDYFTHIRDKTHDWHRDDQEVKEEGYSTHLVAREACRLIAEKDKAKPLFLYVPFNGVHSPLQAPENYLQPYGTLKGPRQKLAGMLAAVDEAIGQIVADTRVRVA